VYGEKLLNPFTFSGIMTYRPVKGVIFDLDGTLIHFNIDWRGLLDELDMERCDILARIASMPGAQRARALEILDRYENEAIEGSEAVDGVRQLLDFLSGEGIPAAVVTRATRERALAIIEKHGFLLGTVIGRDEMKPKPAPDAIHEAARLMGCTAEDCLVVGDFVYDIEAGKSAGARTVLLRRDYPVSFENNADFTVDSPGEIIALIERLNRGIASGPHKSGRERKST